MGKFILSLLFFFGLSTMVFANSNTHIGLVKGIWLSSTDHFAGEFIKINVALFNENDNKVQGSLNFLSNNNVIGSEEFSAEPRTIIQVSKDYILEYGDSTFSTLIEYINILDDSGLIVDRLNSSELLEQNLIFSDQIDINVDYDTDGDGIGNTEDEDDDSDGYSDEIELSAGTDPLSALSKPDISLSLGYSPISDGRKILEETIENLEEKIKKSDSRVKNFFTTSLGDTSGETDSELLLVQDLKDRIESFGIDYHSLDDIQKTEVINNFLNEIIKEDGGILKKVLSQKILDSDKEKSKYLNLDKKERQLVVKKKTIDFLENIVGSPLFYLFLLIIIYFIYKLIRRLLAY